MKDLAEGRAATERFSAQLPATAQINNVTHMILLRAEARKVF